MHKNAATYKKTGGGYACQRVSTIFHIQSTAKAMSFYGPASFSGLDILSLRTRDRETLRHSGTVSELESGELRLAAVNIFTKRKDPVAMQRWCRWGPDTGDLVTEPITEYLAPHNFWLR